MKNSVVRTKNNAVRTKNSLVGGANPNAANNDGKTALDFAKENGFSEIERILRPPRFHSDINRNLRRDSGVCRNGMYFFSVVLPEWNVLFFSVVLREWMYFFFGRFAGRDSGVRRNGKFYFCGISQFVSGGGGVGEISFR